MVLGNLARPVWRRGRQRRHVRDWLWAVAVPGHHGGRLCLRNVLLARCDTKTTTTARPRPGNLRAVHSAAPGKCLRRSGERRSGDAGAVVGTRFLGVHVLLVLELPEIPAVLAVHPDVAGTRDHAAGTVGVPAGIVGVIAWRAPLRGLRVAAKRSRGAVLRHLRSRAALLLLAASSVDPRTRRRRRLPPLRPA